MIRVPQFQPPPEYNLKARSRGRIFLAGTPKPTNAQWRTREYWSLAHDDLYKLYGGICVYSASWTARKRSMRIKDNTSVDHFLPKSIYPELAYEWDNFRLCRSQLNHRKGSSLDIIDPFWINDDWFQLDFYTFRVEPNNAVSEILRNRIKLTTQQLGLNDEAYIKERIGVLKQYCIYGAPLAKIKSKYPFIAREISRTDFDILIKPIFIRTFA